MQLGRSCRSDNPRLGVTLLPDGEVVGWHPIADLKISHPKPRRTLADAGSIPIARRPCDAASAAIDDGADLVIINRFGRSEAEGKGLIDLIPQALDADIPVLIAVPEQRFAAWIRFSEGMNVRLACRRDALDRWWRAVAGRPGGAAAPARSARSRNEAPPGAAGVCSWLRSMRR